MNKKYYLGLDIGTDSVGYAVTDEEYNLLKFKGEPAWGVTVFDAASLNDERRSFRSARRRLDRRQQRVALIQDIFAAEIDKIDARFFVRLQESNLYREDTEDKHIFFNDENYTDVDYFKEYPTIHHLICELMNSKEPHDVRLVYLACAWLVAHRGHFLSNISKENISEIKDFEAVYAGVVDYFTNNNYVLPWEGIDCKQFSDVLKKKMSVSAKQKELVSALYGKQKPSKEGTEDFPFSREAIVKLLAGGTCKLQDLFCNPEYAEVGSVALGMDDDKMGEIMASIGDDYDLIAVLRTLYDWSLLVDTLGEVATISEAKVETYNKHKSDLALLKTVVKKYCPEKYDEVFRATNKDNYAAYVYHNDEWTKDLKKKNKEDFSKYLLGVLKGIEPDEEDKPIFDKMMNDLELRRFMPKQKDTDNRVIPHQLMWYELHTLLKNATEYLPFLTEQDVDGITPVEKIESTFLFRIPYFVGPLNANSKFAWLKREAGKIYPWNFDKMVDLDASEQNFIQRMTNTCTYIPGEPVLPKDSLAYHKFTVLNEINNLRINGERISVELKQQIYTELFLNVKKVTRKKLVDFLVSNNYLRKGEEDSLTGIDEEIKSNLVPQIAFKRLMQEGILNEEEVERIIERASYAEDKSRLNQWLVKEFAGINEADRKYICSLKLKEFGRLSRYFLCELEGVCKETEEEMTILGALWNTQSNLMELLSENYTFNEAVEEYRKQYYMDRPVKLEDRLEEMYISNAVKRPIYRTLDIVRDIQKAFGAPAKIFVEMTRGGDEDAKGKRTKSRYQQILDLYALCKDEDVRVLRKQLEELGERADSLLQGDKLFLYYMQLGKSMYSGKTIDISKLSTKEYDIDHIYPQAYVKDDSILNNKVLVLSEENGAKSDTYPISDTIRHSMRPWWDHLKAIGLITEEKHKRLVRATPFTEEEKYGFINRQLTETSQSTKAIATLLGERYPDAEIVYCKARLASDFRHEFDIWKSRLFNDLHHAVDAYLNIVTGNVYNMKFTKNFNVHQSYSIKTKTVFTHPLIINGHTVWDGAQMLEKVKKTAGKNNAHFTKFSQFKRGELFAQQPKRVSEGVIPLKQGRSVERYGGYYKAGISFVVPVKYKTGKKEELIIMTVEMMHSAQFLKDNEYARKYTYERLKNYYGKNVTEVSFPFGMRPWKINTILSFDGFKCCITGTGDNGAVLLLQTIEQFSADSEWRYYIKKIEKYAEKLSGKTKIIYDPTYDKITKDKNLELYDLYIDKLENTIYAKRYNSPIETLKKGRNSFNDLSIEEQTRTIMSIQRVFGRMSGGCDLTSIGGVKNAAECKISTNMKNWSKYYSDVRIIDMSPSGLWEKKSNNLLDSL